MIAVASPRPLAWSARRSSREAARIIVSPTGAAFQHQNAPAVFDRHLYACSPAPRGRGGIADQRESAGRRSRVAAWREPLAPHGTSAITVCVIAVTSRVRGTNPEFLDRYWPKNRATSGTRRRKRDIGDGFLERGVTGREFAPPNSGGPWEFPGNAPGVARGHGVRSQEPVTSCRERGVMSDTIEARGLTKRYGATLAVDDLSFTVEPGRVTGFLGPNGAGKSTTMRLVLGLDAPSAGAVTVGGRHYRELDRPLHKVGALLEARACHPGRSAANHLLALAQTAGIGRARVEEVLGLVGLANVAGRRVGTFSLGMSQRLGIAAALLGDPPVLMF